MLELKLKGTTSEEKLNYLNSTINTSGAKEQYQEGIDKRFHNLSEDIYISKKVEAYASWLLKGVVIPEEEKGKFDLLTDKQRLKSEVSKLVYLAGETNEADDKYLNENKATGNQYKSNAIVITSALLKEQSELGEILREYQPLRAMLGQELQKIKTKQKSNLTYTKVREHLTEVNADMKLTITYKKGLDGLRPSPTKARAIDSDTIDYGNWKVIKKLIGTGLIDLKNRTTCKNEMLSIVTVDLIGALKAIKISALDSSIISMYNDGWQIQEIGKEISLHHSNVGRRINKICKLLSIQLC